MPQLDMLLTRLDADSNVRGRQFERICEWYLTHDPAYRRQLQRVWLWAEWPQRAGPDTGIDLVAEDKQGHLWAIQAKAYSPDHTVTKRDIDTFLSASSTLEFSFRLLIATTDRIGANAKRTIEGQEKPVHLHMLTDLQHAEIEWPADPSDLHAPRPPIKSPRPHQQEAIDAAARGFEGHDRGQLIMACGTGKTLTALWITEHLQSNRTLVLVPSLSLLKDTLRAWTAQTSTHFAFLPVCSDSTVRGSDEWVSSTTELGFPVTTDPDEIATFMGQDGPLVVFSTYQSSPRIAEAQSSGAVPEFNLVIADEAHRVTGPVSSDFATILDSSAIRAGRRLFATATPRYFTDRIREEAGEADFELASMDNTAMFGPVFHRLPFGEAIERDLLSDYQVAIIGVDDRVCRQLAERGVFVRRDGAEVTDARTLASHIGLAKAMRDFDLRKTISFHSRINRAREFADDFVDVVEWIPQDQRPVGELVTSHVSGKMTAGQRHLRIRQLDQLEDTQRGLLSNARCLGEGIDVPTLDGVAFIDPRSSQIDIIQAVGRAIRKAENKTFGTIILPVFIDKNEDPDTALSSSVFKPIWTVLKALRSHDDDLAEQLDQLRRQLGRRQTITRPHKIHVDLPKHVSQAFAHAFEVRLIESSTASWEMWFALLEDYVDREGHANVPAQYVVEGRQLGQWCSHQRRHYTTGRLPEERITRLNALGFLWEPFRAAWEEGFAKLEAFVEREGHALAEHDHIEDGYKLGKWCSHQRSSYTQGKLAGERIARLEALGFVWNKPAAAWEKGFDCLAQFVAREGHAVVADDYIEDGYKLGLWGSNQRRSYTAGRLSEERISRLEALGFVWDLIEAAWEEGFCNLRAFVEREGHANVSSGHLEDDYRLGQWCSQQRKSYTQGKLTGERIARLEALGFVWNKPAAAWAKGLQYLAQFVEREGHANVPARYVEDGYPLGQWCNIQRQLYKRRSKSKGQSREKPVGLAEDRIARLEALGFEWDPRSEAAWEEGLASLERFVAREGHANVPHRHVEDGYLLGRWCGRQRTASGRGDLSEERIALLDELGFVWEREDVWEGAFSLLKQYVAREGHANVPKHHVEDGYRLGLWCVRQRKSFRGRGESTKAAPQGKSQPLSAERIVRLDALGFVWEPLEAAWERGYGYLALFLDREGHTNVPADYVHDDYPLGKWCRRQRTAFTNGNLSEERIALLEALGFVWKLREAAWEDAFAYLVQFVSREGHANVPNTHVESGYGLGVWRANQRKAYRMGRLSEKQVDRLESLPGWTWDARVNG